MSKLAPRYKVVQCFVSFLYPWSGRPNLAVNVPLFYLFDFFYPFSLSSTIRLVNEIINKCGSGWRIRLQCRRPGLDPWVSKIPWRRAWQPTPVFLPGESQDRRAWGAAVHGVAKSWHDWAVTLSLLFLSSSVQSCSRVWLWSHGLHPGRESYHWGKASIGVPGTEALSLYL